jgi:hypothetical protein
MSEAGCATDAARVSEIIASPSAKVSITERSALVAALIIPARFLKKKSPRKYMHRDLKILETRARWYDQQIKSFEFHWAILLDPSLHESEHDRFKKLAAGIMLFEEKRFKQVISQKKVGE